MNRSYALLATCVLLIACTSIQAQEVRWERPFELAILNMQMAIDSGGVVYALGDTRSDLGTPSIRGWRCNRSTDNGTTWSRSNNGVPSLLFSLASDAAGSLYAGSTYGLYHSTDSGNTWSVMNAVGWNVSAVGVGPDGTLFAGTHYGTVYRSTDRGLTWESDTLQPEAGPLNFAFAGDGSVVLATSQGIYRSTDNGLSWNVSSDGMDSLSPAPWWDKPPLVATPWGDLYTAYYAMMYRSTDNGKSWEKMEQTWPGYKVTGILGTAQGELFSGTAPNGGVLRSTERGVTWEQTVQDLLSEDRYPYEPVNVTQMFVTRSGVMVAATDSASIIRTVTSDVAGVSESVAAGKESIIAATVIPNPATLISTMRLTMPHAGHLRIELVDSRGARVAVLSDALMAAGEHMVTVDVRDIPEGVYFCRLSMDGTSFSTPSPIVVKR
jgi:photosystem II stability/assembly factor-like uncharacterized protein